jgi:hypothetical protein
MREVGRLVTVMRGDRTPPVPESARERALSVFVPRQTLAPARRSLVRTARLVFDSLREPLPAAARRAAGDARRLRFALGEYALELESEHDAPGLVTLRGRLETPDPPLHRLDVAAAVERLSIWPDADGAFVLNNLPPGRMRVTVSGPVGCYRVPSFRA